MSGPAATKSVIVRLQDLLAPYPAGDMEAYPVSTHVNKPTNDDPGCVVRLG